MQRTDESGIEFLRNHLARPPLIITLARSGTSMIGFIKKLLGREDPLPFDIEKAVGQLLLSLPRCSSKLVVASPNYGDEHYKCDVVVDANSLMPWAEHHAEAVWSSDNEAQAARRALPVWLRGANVIDLKPTFVPPAVVVVLRPYVSTFFEEGIAEAFCHDCRSSFRDVFKKRFNERLDGPWSFWTDEWHCPAGHLLYLQDHELHILRR
jgi:hypothetical protein